MHRIRTTFLACALALAASTPTPSLAAPGAREEARIDFDRAARAFLESRGVRDPKPDATTLDAVIEQHFVRARLGAFDVLLPKDGLEKHAESAKSCAQALLEAQSQWLEWLEPAKRDTKALRADLAHVAAWVKGWKTPMLAKLASGAGGDLGSLLGASESHAAAIERLSKAQKHGEALGPARETPIAARIFLMPTRRDFVEFLALLGWLDPSQRPHYWLDAAADWSQAHFNADQIVALEYGVPNRPAGKYDQGMGLATDDPTVMQQQVVQLALNELFDALYEGRAPGAFVQGLSMNVVIDQFGEIGTRIDGDLRARVTGKREAFVPGGNKDGGFLSKNSADTRWRVERGKDHWMALLRSTQKEGEEQDRGARNRWTMFAVHSDDGGKRHLVRAPFLGAAAAATTAPPADFAGDFAELLRAYKSAFIHWLQTRAAGGEKPSREAFAKLLVKLADPKLAGEFESVFAELYGGKALSNAECDKECLEGQFLLWLQKQK